MTKLIPIFIEGKKWIQLSQLPSEQVRAIRSCLPVDSLKKVIFQGLELSDCLDFDTYEWWFRTQAASIQKQALFEF